MLAIEAPPLSVRQASENDWKFIYSSWIKSSALSWYKANRFWIKPKLLSPDFDEIYSAGVAKMIDRLRSHDSTLFAVATPPRDGDFIVGWCCLGPGLVHYCYVRESFRRAGVASMLIGDRHRVVCTSWTLDCEAISRDKPGVLQYEPSKRR